MKRVVKFHTIQVVTAKNLSRKLSSTFPAGISYETRPLKPTNQNEAFPLIFLLPKTMYWVSRSINIPMHLVAISYDYDDDDDFGIEQDARS